MLGGFCQRARITIILYTNALFLIISCKAHNPNASQSHPAMEARSSSLQSSELDLNLVKVSKIFALPEVERFPTVGVKDPLNPGKGTKNSLPPIDGSTDFHVSTPSLSFNAKAVPVESYYKVPVKVHKPSYVVVPHAHPILEEIDKRGFFIAGTTEFRLVPNVNIDGVKGSLLKARSLKPVIDVKGVESELGRTGKVLQVENFREDQNFDLSIALANKMADLKPNFQGANYKQAIEIDVGGIPCRVQGLGAGVSGYVWSVSAQIPGQKLPLEFAVKRNPSSSIKSEKYVREIAVGLGMSRHPDSAQLYGAYYRAGDGYYLVMDRLPGKTISELEYEDNLWEFMTSEDVLRGMHDIVSPIAAMHAANFRHGDIGIQNVIMDKMRIYLYDYGGSTDKDLSDNMVGEVGRLGTLLQSLVNWTSHNKYPSTITDIIERMRLAGTQSDVSTLQSELEKLLLSPTIRKSQQ